MADIREIRQQGPYHYVFGPYADPIARVKPGETIAIHTIDAFGDRITSETTNRASPRARTSTRRPARSTSKAPSRATRWRSRSSRSKPRATGPSAHSFPTSAGSPPPADPRCCRPAARGAGLEFYQPNGRHSPARQRLRFPWRPFLGTIGTAPHIEAISSLAPGNHGGNMDVPDITTGQHDLPAGAASRRALLHRRCPRRPGPGRAVRRRAGDRRARRLHLRSDQGPGDRMAADRITRPRSWSSAAPARWRTPPASPTPSWSTGWPPTTASTASTPTSSSPRPAALRRQHGRHQLLPGRGDRQELPLMADSSPCGPPRSLGSLG